MQYFRIFLILLSTASTKLAAQDFSGYKNIYNAGRSLEQSGIIGQLDEHVFRVADSLDQHAPIGYFDKSGDYLKNQKYNEASFLYFLGTSRYRYYNASNPQYQESDDGALLGSMLVSMGEPINTYLKLNIDNFISILESALLYYQSKDYNYYSKEKDLEKYEMQVRIKSNTIEDLKTNKVKYERKWKKESKKMEKLVDQAIKDSYKFEKMADFQSNAK